MQLLVDQIHKLLLKKRLTVAAAESCTGGLLSKLLTDLPDSSRYFLAGFVVYSNQAKTRLLGIPPSLITRQGAVSEKVAVLMAKNARKTAKADFGIGITGIAGPAGGNALKPIGTVYIAIAHHNKTRCYLFRFKGNRQIIRKNAALKSLGLLKTLL